MDDRNLILTYVPESKYLTYNEALALALKRDEQAADAFMQGVPDSEKMPVLVTRMPESEKRSLRQRAGLRPWEPWSAVGGT